MIRTKHLVVGIFALAVLVSVSGLRSLRDSGEVLLPTLGVTFGTPRDSYGVVVEDRDDRVERREAFIASVRSALRSDPVLEEGPEVEIVQVPEVKEEPAPSEVLIFNTTEIYDDAISLATPTGTTTATLSPVVTPPAPTVQATSTHE